MEWLPAGSFHSDDRYKDSEIYKNLKEHFTLKRKSDTQFGAVENYVCRVSRRAGYVKCPKQFRVIFPDDSQSVHVEETNGSHNHSRSEEIEKEDPHYRWSQLATQIITEGVINNLKPTVIRRNLRSHNALSDPEPSRIQLNNKISFIKRKGNLVEHCDTTLSLRNKLKDYLDIPDDENCRSHYGDGHPADVADPKYNFERHMVIPQSLGVDVHAKIQCRRHWYCQQ